MKNLRNGAKFFAEAICDLDGRREPLFSNMRSGYEQFCDSNGKGIATVFMSFGTGEPTFLVGVEVAKQFLVKNGGALIPLHHDNKVVDHRGVF